ncbi:MAG: DMT family transporter [Candidatus Eremiobacteraeota bacterium]|nr:DMT family transporter [Candidatus Eremiobacteraeota bacterium]
MLAAGVIWGAGGPVTKWLIDASGIPGIDFASLAFARSVWALPMLGVVAAVRRPVRILAGDWRLFGALAAINAVMNVLFPLAAQQTSAAHLTLVYGANAPIVAVFESIFRKVSLDLRGKVAAACGILGVVVVSLTKSTSGATVAGDAILIVWLIGFGAQAVITRVLAERYSSGFITGLSWGMASLTIVAVGLPFGLWHALAAPTSTPVAAAAFLGVLVAGMTFVAPTAFTRAAKATSAAVATGATYYLALCVGLVLSITILHETLRPGGIAGAVLLFVGIGLMMLPRRKATPAYRRRPDGSWETL